jgi:putative transposase
MRLYPTVEQEKYLENVLEINRVVYNYFVINKLSSRNDMNYALTELKEQQPILHQYHSKMLQMISTKVAGARSALDELKKRRYEAGNGKLQLLKAGECNSFVYNQSGYRIEKCTDGNQAMLYLARIGHIEIRVALPALARHIMDSSWGIFKQMLQYKANRVVEVEPYNTSVNCSTCGNKVP